MLKPGESVSIDVYPAGETGIALAFWTATGSFDIQPDGYLEGGGMYSARVRIAKDFSVEVDTELSPL